MKKLISIIVTIVLMLCSACGLSSPTPILTPEITPSPSPEASEITKEMLAGYSIVYPSSYNEYRMEDVHSFRNSISWYIGKNLSIVADNEARPENAIILADSSLEHQYSSKISELNGTLGYIIAFDEQTEDIIVGGSNYYATLLAMEQFKQMLSSDDIEVLETEYLEYSIEFANVPTIACTLKTMPFTTLEQFNKMIEQGYNGVVIDASLYNERQLHNVVKWCATNCVGLIMRSYVSKELYFDCPAVKGHLIVDEPYGDDAYEWYSLDSKKYADACRQYGWEPYVNLICQYDVIERLENDPDLFTAVDSFCIKLTNSKIVDTVTMLARVQEYASSANKDFVVGVDLTSAFGSHSAEDTALLRAALGICLGAVGVEYFCYSGDGHTEDSSYEITDASNIIKRINNLIDMLDDCQRLGAIYFRSYVTNAYGQTAYNELFTESITSYGLENCVIADFVDENGEHAFVVLNLNKDKALYFEANDSAVIVTNSDNITQDCTEFEVSGADFVIVKLAAEE